MERRDFLQRIGGAAAARMVWGVPLGVGASHARLTQAPDVTLHIAPVALEIAPRHVVRTTGYNGSVPGPLIRLPEGRPTTIEVHNDTGSPELVHWHGLSVPGIVDGAVEEGTPVIGPHQIQQYQIVPRPSGTRWYHTHVSAGRDLGRATYTGQYGFLYVEPRDDPARYDAEVFLALHGWEGYLGTADGGEGTLDVIYRSYSVNAHSLGSGEPVRVQQGQRVMLRILNANATLTHRIAMAGHRFSVVALDGNPVPTPSDVCTLELGPAERIDAIVTMDQPGVWVLGEIDDQARRTGLGIVVEYAGQQGAPRWMPPARERWDYTVFGRSAETGPGTVSSDVSVVPVVFRKKFAGSRWVDNWTVNDRSFPDTQPIQVQSGVRYRFRLDNRSDEAHPIHLHRHSFELVKVAGTPTSGVRKDVVVVPPNSEVDVDVIPDGLGRSLLHCHNQLHMDYGFMTMMECT